MRVLISEKLSEHKYKTPEGYLICTDAILARTGKQTYTRDELFGDGDNTEVNVDRPYNEVMNEKTIASFENKPVTFDHPEEDVNIGNYKSYAVGYVRDVRQGKVDGKDVILGNLVITDQDAINAIENGDHTDLSCGYDCDIKDDGNGNYAQNNIRGNHVALCKEGRAGMARIVDSKVKDSKIYMQNQEFNKAFGKDEEYYIILKYGVRIFRHYGRVVIVGSRQALEQLYKDYHLRDYNVTIDDSKAKDAGDYGWFKGYINGDLQSFNIDSLISSVKSKKRPLHANLTGKSGNVYTVFIDGNLESDVDKGSGMWIDIVVEYPDRQQKRLISKDFNSWNECRNIFNTFKNNLRDSVDDSKVKDSNYIYEFYYNDIDNEDKRMMRKYNLEVVGKSGKDRGQRNLAVKGSLENLKRYAKDWLGYELHPDYLIPESQFAYDMYDSVKDNKVEDADEWTIKNTGLDYEVWNGGKLIKKFATKKQAIEWIQDRFPEDNVIEDSKVNDDWEYFDYNDYDANDVVTVVITDKRFSPLFNKREREILQKYNVRVQGHYLNGTIVKGKVSDIRKVCNECYVMDPYKVLKDSKNIVSDSTLKNFKKQTTLGDALKILNVIKSIKAKDINVNPKEWFVFDADLLSRNYPKINQLIRKDNDRVYYQTYSIEDWHGTGPKLIKEGSITSAHPERLSQVITVFGSAQEAINWLKRKKGIK